LPVKPTSAAGPERSGGLGISEYLRDFVSRFTFLAGFCKPQPEVCRLPATVVQIPGRPEDFFRFA
jgi:hypothetical protein